MSQNAPPAGAARAVPVQKNPNESEPTTSPIVRQAEGADQKAATNGAVDDAVNAVDVVSDGSEESRDALAEAEKAEKAAEKAARKAKKAHEKTVAREARKAAEAEDAALTASGKLRFESPVGRDEVAAYFEAIVEGLRKGSLQFRQGEQSLILSPPDRVEIGVKVERKGGREKLRFEIDWRTDEPEDLSILAG